MSTGKDWEDPVGIGQIMNIKFIGKYGKYENYLIPNKTIVSMLTKSHIHYTKIIFSMYIINKNYLYSTSVYACDRKRPIYFNIVGYLK